MSRINNREPEVNETTRLLQHSIRIARENEDIGMLNRLRLLASKQ